MRQGRKVLAFAGGTALFLGGASQAGAVYYADQVISYTEGTGATGFNTPGAALYAPDGITGENDLFGWPPNVLSPFSPAFKPDEIVKIGNGGQLTLRLSHYALAGAAGSKIGVVSNVGLIDGSWPNGEVVGSAMTYGGGQAEVSVSPDGSTWYSLGTKTFELPAMYFVNAGPYDPAAPATPQMTDFGVPLDRHLVDFDGKTWPETVGLFKMNGVSYSGGGTWFDLSEIPPAVSQVGYIRFTTPADGGLCIDAVVIANNAAGAVVVPEPASAALLFIGGAALLSLRRRSRRS